MTDAPPHTRVLAREQLTCAWRKLRRLCNARHIDTLHRRLQRRPFVAPMKIRLLALVGLAGLLCSPAVAHAAEPAATGWHAQSLGQAVGYMLLFTFIGVLAAIGGYKLFDKCTPGDLHREILENKNVAAAIVAAAVILGVCIIVAAAMLG